MKIPGASVRNAPFFMQFSLLFSFLHLFMENSMEKKGKKEEGGNFFPGEQALGQTVKPGSDPEIPHGWFPTRQRARP